MEMDDSLDVRIVFGASQRGHHGLGTSGHGQWASVASVYRGRVAIRAKTLNR